MNEIKLYFKDIDEKIEKAYGVAGAARLQGYDPTDKIEIPLAKNLAERVQGLISIVAPQITESNFLERIKVLEQQFGLQDWRVAFKIALEFAQERICKFEDKIKAMEIGLRVGLAYLTVGVVSSPLEGFTRLQLKKRLDNQKEYFCLNFSGPIRSAGTTAVCVFLALSDYIRKNMGYAEYDPTEDEINRIKTEVADFHERITNLQYLPSEKELEFIVKHLPLQIDGEGSEKLEVSNYKDSPRFETNKISNGSCLVFGEGITQKGAKFWGKFEKLTKELDMEHWKFMADFVKLQKKIRSKGQIKEKENEKILPDYNYIKDVVAGRPVLGHPLRCGAFRLRYGRTRMSGFSEDAIHPATMKILSNYLAIGTQLKIERPGKSTVLVACDSLEGPIVKLKNGSVIKVDTKEQAEDLLPEVEEIIYLGDILINYGDFFNRAHILLPPGYCEEWWFQELKKAEPSKSNLITKLGLKENLVEAIFKDPILTKISFEDAYEISKKLKIPLHPRYTFYWRAINKEQLHALTDWLDIATVKREDNEIQKIIFTLEHDTKKIIEKEDPKRALELIGIPHITAKDEYVVIEKDYAKAFASSLGFYSELLDKEKIKKLKELDYEDPLESINKVSEIEVRDKSGYFIGSRMGRPEKAKQRKLTGSPNVLFPVGEEGGRLRCFQSALEKGKIKAQFSTYFCEGCNKTTVFPKCEACDKKTKKQYYCYPCKEDSLTEKCPKHGKNQTYKTLDLNITSVFNDSMKKLKLKQYPSLIKGVRGTSNKNHASENLAKGILRASYNLYVNKDGTTRYDMTEQHTTHFKPKEIRTSIEKLKELGYIQDIHDQPLKDKDQILEIMPQDVILPSCPNSLEEGADQVLFRVANFIDDCLARIYNQPAFYNLKTKEDLVGHLLVCLSPHTAAGVTGRIIGFSKTQGFITHAYTHSLMRRDCDGDEAGVMLLMDALINFSREFLPAHRGATQDEPLVLTSKIIPFEVDDMIFDMDIVKEYPLEFYEACLAFKMPWDIKIKQIKDILNTDNPYQGTSYTHEVDDINNANTCSSYKLIPTMQEKVQGQMELAEKIRAVDESDVARLVIERHFIRDIKGNLRKFSMQQFRCVNCNEKYRRPPLKGCCLKCNGRLIFTISGGSIIKYLEPALSLADKYDIPHYLKQSLELTKQRIESVFGKESEKQEGLGRWFQSTTNIN